MFFFFFLRSIAKEREIFQVISDFRYDLQWVRVRVIRVIKGGWLQTLLIASLHQISLVLFDNNPISRQVSSDVCPNEDSVDFRNDVNRK